MIELTKAGQSRYRIVMPRAADAKNRFAAPDMQEAERLVADGFLAAAAGTLQ